MRFAFSLCSELRPCFFRVLDYRGLCFFHADPNKASKLGQIMSLQLRAIELTSLEQRVEKVEKQLVAKSQQTENRPDHEATKACGYAYRLIVNSS
jgi:hypothetical protein